MEMRTYGRIIDATGNRQMMRNRRREVSSPIAGSVVFRVINCRKLGEPRESATIPNEVNAVDGIVAIAMDDVYSTFHLCRTWWFGANKSPKNHSMGSTKHLNEMSWFEPDLSQFGRENWHFSNNFQKKEKTCRARHFSEEIQKSTFSVKKPHNLDFFHAENFVNKS
jgi:hypothetical protein